MSDTPAGSNPHRSATDRAREDRELFPLRGQTYDMAMQMARDGRRMRAAAAAHDAIGQAHDLAGHRPCTGSAQVLHSDPMWEVRGEARTRETFGHPHPADFPGGMPLPGECPRLPRVI